MTPLKLAMVTHATTISDGPWNARSIRVAWREADKRDRDYFIRDAKMLLRYVRVLEKPSEEKP